MQGRAERATGAVPPAYRVVLAIGPTWVAELAVALAVKIEAASAANTIYNEVGLASDKVRWATRSSALAAQVYSAVPGHARLSIDSAAVFGAWGAAEEARRDALTIYSEIVEALREGDIGRADDLLNRTVADCYRFWYIIRKAIDRVSGLLDLALAGVGPAEIARALGQREGRHLEDLLGDYARTLYREASEHLESAVLAAARSRAVEELHTSISEVE